MTIWRGHKKVKLSLQQCNELPSSVWPEVATNVKIGESLKIYEEEQFLKENKDAISIGLVDVFIMANYALS